MVWFKRIKRHDDLDKALYPLVGLLVTKNT